MAEVTSPAETKMYCTCQECGVTFLVDIKEMVYIHCEFLEIYALCPACNESVNVVNVPAGFKKNSNNITEYINEMADECPEILIERKLKEYAIGKE